MKIVAWDSNTNLMVEPERLPLEGEWAAWVSEGSDEWGDWVDGDLSKVRYKKHYTSAAYVQVVRVITVGAMQSRFSILEEIAISEGADSVVKILYSRLLNSKSIDLDFKELVEGVAYTVNYLSTLGVLLDEVDAATRIDQLLKNGTTLETY